MLLLNEVIQKGFDPGIFIGGLASHLRNLMVSRDAQTLPLLEVSEGMRQRFQEQAARCEPRFLYRAIKLCNDCDQNYRTSRNKRLQVEICLIQAAQPEEVGAGRRPKTLAPLFKAPQTQSGEPQSVAAANTRQATPATTSQAAAANPPLRPVLPASAEPVKPVSVRTVSGFGPSLLHPQQNMQPRQTAASVPAHSASDSGQPARPLDDHDLTLFWRQAANLLPVEYKALTQRMEDIQVVIQDATHFSFTVNNDIVRDTFQQVMPVILQHIRQGFHNDAIQCTIQVAKVEAAQILTKPDILRQMVEHNPSLLRMQDLLQLSLL